MDYDPKDDLLFVAKEVSDQTGIEVNELLKLAEKREFISKGFLEEIKSLEGGSLRGGFTVRDFFRWAFKFMLLIILLQCLVYVFYVPALFIEEQAENIITFQRRVGIQAESSINVLINFFIYACETYSALINENGGYFLLEFWSYLNTKLGFAVAIIFVILLFKYGKPDVATFVSTNASLPPPPPPSSTAITTRPSSTTTTTTTRGRSTSRTPRRTVTQVLEQQNNILAEILRASVANNPTVLNTFNNLQAANVPQPLQLQNQPANQQTNTTRGRGRASSRGRGGNLGGGEIRRFKPSEIQVMQEFMDEVIDNITNLFKEKNKGLQGGAKLTSERLSIALIGVSISVLLHLIYLTFNAQTEITKEYLAEVTNVQNRYTARLSPSSVSVVYDEENPSQLQIQTSSKTFAFKFLYDQDSVEEIYNLMTYGNILNLKDFFSASFVTGNTNNLLTLVNSITDFRNVTFQISDFSAFQTEVNETGVAIIQNSGPFNRLSKQAGIRISETQDFFGQIVDFSNTSIKEQVTLESLQTLYRKLPDIPAELSSRKIDQDFLNDLLQEFKENVSFQFEVTSLVSPRTGQPIPYLQILSSTPSTMQNFFDASFGFLSIDEQFLNRTSELVLVPKEELINNLKISLQAPILRRQANISATSFIQQSNQFQRKLAQTVNEGLATIAGTGITYAVTGDVLTSVGAGIVTGEGYSFFNSFQSFIESRGKTLPQQLFTQAVVYTVHKSLKSFQLQTRFDTIPTYKLYTSLGFATTALLYIDENLPNIKKYIQTPELYEFENFFTLPSFPTIETDTTTTQITYTRPMNLVPIYTVNPYANYTETALSISSSLNSYESDSRLFLENNVYNISMYSNPYQLQIYNPYQLQPYESILDPSRISIPELRDYLLSKYSNIEIGRLYISVDKIRQKYMKDLQYILKNTTTTNRGEIQSLQQKIDFQSNILEAIYQAFEVSETRTPIPTVTAFPTLLVTPSPSVSILPEVTPTSTAMPLKSKYYEKWKGEGYTENEIQERTEARFQRYLGYGYTVEDILKYYL